MGFVCQGLWVMGYCGLMGYGLQIPTHQLGGPKWVWDFRGYGLSGAWVKRVSTVSVMVAAADAFRLFDCYLKPLGENIMRKTVSMTEWSVVGHSRRVAAVLPNHFHGKARVHVNNKRQPSAYAYHLPLQQFRTFWLSFSNHFLPLDWGWRQVID